MPAESHFVRPQQPSKDKR